VTNIKIINCKFNNTKSNRLNNVSKLQISNTLINGIVPLKPSPVAGFTEAEAYSDKSEWGWSNVLQGFSGNGYMEFANSKNFIEWEVQKSQIETDTLIIRYANVNQNNKPCELYINGNKVDKFAFAPTGSVWKTEQKIVSFKSGKNTIRLVSIADEPGAYIDRFSIVNSSPKQKKITP
jgi:hypothetical protein